MAGKAARKVYNSARWQHTRADVLRASNWRCAKCGKYANEVHHRKPIHQGGAPFARSNLMATCRTCHYGEHMTADRRSLKRDLRALRVIATQLLTRR